MKFKYTAFDKTGKKQKGIIEADNIQSAKAQLKNLVILDIKPYKSFSFNISFSKKVNKNELSKLFLTLGLYLKSSIPLINAIKLTKNQLENPKLIRFLDFVEKEVKEGKSFFNAIESQNIIYIPPYIINSIKVGEESGKLAIVLIEMAKFLKDEDKLFSKTKQALIYPLFIIIVAIFMIGFMLTTVVPKIVKVFENLNQKLPSITVFVINTGNFLKENYLIISISILAIIALFIFSYKKIYKFRFFIDSLMLKIPVVKKIIISKELGRFSYLVYILTSSGVNYICLLYTSPSPRDS
jgi:type II secretory pathway component PulF